MQSLCSSEQVVIAQKVVSEFAKNEFMSPRETDVFSSSNDTAMFAIDPATFDRDVAQSALCDIL